MSQDDETADERFQVVLNDEEQYSIWDADRELPSGWRAEGTVGSKQACLDHIEQVWTDMRPKSLREALAEGVDAVSEEATHDPADDEPDDALVRSLAEGRHPVVVSGVGDPSDAEAVERFRDSLDRGHVQVCFPETRGGTELGLRFDPASVDRSGCDFGARSGQVALAGELNLDGIDVRCEVELSLGDLSGAGQLHLLS